MLAMFGQQAWAVSLFCVLYGLSNGVLTILRATLPQARWWWHWRSMLALRVPGCRGL